MSDNLTQLSDPLRNYFLGKSGVSMAFLFGSFAAGRATSDSDVDIAVYFEPSGKSPEWEEDGIYEDEDNLWGEVERLVGRSTDLVVLNRAPSTLAFSIIRLGIPLVIKDHSLYLRFYLTISTAAEDFRDFVNDYWAIKQRSRSLSEVDRERLIRVLDFLETELADHNQFRGITRKIYETEASQRRNVERWVENIVNASIDIAKILLASEKKRIPETYRDTLSELSLLEGFEEETARNLASFAKLRNILAHEYLDIRFNQIRKFVDEAEPEYRKLADFVEGLLKGKG